MNIVFSQQAPTEAGWYLYREKDERVPHLADVINARCGLVVIMDNEETSAFVHHYRGFWSPRLTFTEEKTP